MTLNYPRIIKKAIITLALMLALSLLASCSSVNTSSSNISNAVKDQTDLSLSLLGQVFGNVPGVLEGSAGQMLGQLFYYLNLGFLMMTGAFCDKQISHSPLTRTGRIPNLGVVMLLDTRLGWG